MSPFTVEDAVSTLPCFLIKRTLIVSEWSHHSSLQMSPKHLGGCSPLQEAELNPALERELSPGPGFQKPEPSSSLTVETPC